MAISNRNRLVEKFIPVIRQDGLNTNKNVNIGVAGAGSSATLSVGSGGISTTGPLTSSNSVAALTATSSLTAAQSGAVFTVAPAAATVITLPAPVVGLNYTFWVTTAATGTNTLKFITASGIYLQGYDLITTVGSAGTGELFQATAAGTFISFNCNGTTSGGLIGTEIIFTCLTSTLWQVSATNIGSGTLVTSFAIS
jgi:hypothetical protein